MVGLVLLEISCVVLLLYVQPTRYKHEQRRIEQMPRRTVTTMMRDVPQWLFALYDFYRFVSEEEDVGNLQRLQQPCVCVSTFSMVTYQGERSAYTTLVGSILVVHHAPVCVAMLMHCQLANSPSCFPSSWAIHDECRQAWVPHVQQYRSQWLSWQ